MPRYFALALLDNGRVVRNAIVEIAPDGTVATRPFAGEEPRTACVSGIVAACNAATLTAAHRARLAALVADAPSLDRAIADADAYLAANALYAPPSAPPILLPLPRR